MNYTKLEFRDLVPPGTVFDKSQASQRLFVEPPEKADFYFFDSITAKNRKYVWTSKLVDTVYVLKKLRFSTLFTYYWLGFQQSEMIDKYIIRVNRSALILGCQVEPKFTELLGFNIISLKLIKNARIWRYDHITIVALNICSFHP